MQFNKCSTCTSCDAVPAEVIPLESNFVIVGNMNVGKSTLFEKISTGEVATVYLPGIKTSIKRGRIKSQQALVFDTPGILSVFSANEDERASREIFFSPQFQNDSANIIVVADAKNLKRSISIALQYAEYGLPMLLAVNMIDEAVSRGITIDFQKLSEKLGIEACTTIGREGIGVSQLISRLASLRRHEPWLKHAEPVEQFFQLVNKLLKPQFVSARALGLLLLSSDKGVESYINTTFGSGMLEQLQHLAEQCRQELPTDFEISLAQFYCDEASRIVAQIQKNEPVTKNSFLLTFGDWCTSISAGIPIALIMVIAMYFFVGMFGATYLVDTINRIFFDGFIIPWTTKIIAPLPNEFIRDMIIDPDFGVLPTSVFLALGLVAPVMFCFYIAFEVLENSGYLPRLSILLDRVFQKMGMNGKGIVPLVMGFSCVTAAVLTTRLLNTDKEKNIASFLVFLCMPCAPLLAVMFIILDKMPTSATITVFGIIFSQIVVAGILANRIVPGPQSPLLIEIPAMRVPRILDVIRMATLKTVHFMKEAIPVFVVASIVVFIFQRYGGLEFLEKTFGPLISKILGLPDKSIQVFIKTMIRRESGALELEHLRGIFTNLQLVVSLLVMAFLAPCLNAIIVLFKERGSKVGSTIMLAVVIYAIMLGSIVNYTCQVFGITFT